MKAYFYTVSQRLILVLLFVGILYAPRVSATHLMGGELTYEYDGEIPGMKFYIVKLVVYRYCDSSGTTTAPLDPNMFLGVFTGGPYGTTNPLDWFATENLSLMASDFVTAGPGTAGCSFVSTACIERGEYQVAIMLPDNPGGYHLFVERCCRNGNIVNIDSPGAAGMTFYTFIPPGIINSSPQISDVSVPYLCTGDTVSIINNAYDPDGDSLVYSFAVPYNGYSSNVNPMPDPFMDINPYLVPIPQIVYAPGYSAGQFMGSGSFSFIDPVSGLTRYFLPNQGFYVAAIEIREYRSGVLISSIRRDLQFITITCTPNTVPNFQPSGNGTVFTVGEGQTMCFPVNFTDPDGDSLFLQASGTLLDISIVNPPGVIAGASGDSTVTSQFCWTPVCGMSRPTPYQFSVTVTDNGCPAKTSNEVFSVYVTTGPSSQTPAVTVQQSTTGIICQGSAASFTALPVHPGTAPQYQWFVNGLPAGTNSPVFTSNMLVNGDVITVTMVSNATCLITDTAYSPPYTVTIDPTPAPQITLTSNPSNFLCPQQICFFNANVVNAGSSPVYQWHLNGSSAGSNSPLFTAANPSGIMIVYVTVQPSTGCPPMDSDSIIFNIVPSLEPEIQVTASVYDSICPGQTVVFTAASANTGNPPVYTWYLNGVPVGDTTSVLTLNSLTNGDEVSVSVTSGYECLNPDVVFAGPLVFHTYPPLAGNLTDGPVAVCRGETVTLEMEASGGSSSTYVYSWSQGQYSEPVITFSPQFTGYYSAQVNDICYPAQTDSLYIEVDPLPVSDFIWNPVKPSVFAPHVQFSDLSIDAISWLWFIDTLVTEIQNPEYDFPVGGFYPVKLITTNSYGCTDTLTRVLESEQIITAYIPNSFTPNGDGRNDTFGLSGFSTGGYSLSVYNRWGAEVFHSDAGYQVWDGKGKDGAVQPEGVYIYRIVIANDKTQKPYTGTLTLVR